MKPTIPAAIDPAVTDRQLTATGPTVTDRQPAEPARSVDLPARSIPAILAGMTLEEKIALCSGADFWHTKAMLRHGIPALTMADGPHGVRKQIDSADMLGINQSLPATCFPTAAATGCSWDPDLLRQVGEAIASEAAAHGVGLILGPGANIKRNPLCGRNFEYFSEDPLLSGRLAAAWIRGAEAVGVGTSLKHFAANNQEYKRYSSASIVDERTLREIYLAPFELAVKEGKPATVMSAYNKLNGEHCSDNQWLLTMILREEWGFTGAVVTDWGGMGDRIKGFKAGCDLSMPGGSSYMEKEAAEAVYAGRLAESDIDRCAARVLQFVLSSYQKSDLNHPVVDMDGHHGLARRAAAESAVLLKNDDHLLPVKEGLKMVWIGHMAQEIRYQGTGSSHINPWSLVQPTDARSDIPFTAGCLADGSTSDALLAEATAAAKSADVAVVFAGLTDSYESEGFDRDHMRMPAGHIRLIEAVAKANPNTAVVLMSGSAVEIPWDARVKSILYMGLPGQAGGEAIVDLLTGRAVPCGKLAESWPIRYEDCVSSSYYGQSEFDSRQSQPDDGQSKPDSSQSEPDGSRSKPDSRQGKFKCSQEQNDLRVQVPYRDAHYREGIYVGYRYYASSGTEVRYPFGHGLSYTEFVYSDLVVQGDLVTFCVTNTGLFPGKEIAQVYISPLNGTETATRLYRPRIELKAFDKVALEPGESKTVTLQLDARSFAIWHNGWQILAGRYAVQVGSSSTNLPLDCMVEKAAMSLPDSGRISVATEIQAKPMDLKQTAVAADAAAWISSPESLPELISRPEVLPDWYVHPHGHPSHQDWEQMLGRSVSSKPLRKGQFAMDDSVMEMKDHSLVMRIFYKAILHTIKRRLGGKMDESDPHFRMVISSAADASLSCMKINGGMNNHLLEGLLEMANGRYLRGIRVMLTGKN